jgi:hypothetical protein
MQLAEERRDLLPLVKAAYDVALGREEAFPAFPGTRVWALAPGLAPNLGPLVKYGILVPDGESSRGRAYYRMPDLAGVERALRELGLLSD